MLKFYTNSDVSKWSLDLKSKNKTIGFVPTMGALHQGHLELMKNSLRENDYTIVSIFVNPTQFNNAEDLKKYPRNTEKDILLLQSIKADAVYLPAVEDIYPEGEKSENYDFGGIEKEMEGAFRPGHFDGVATVVNRFFEIVKPDKAYFGEKDFQQLRIIQELVKQKHPSIKIVPVPIVRAESGLALSSRNERLNSEELSEAAKIYKILSKAKKQIKTSSVEDVKSEVLKNLENTSFELEYFEITDEETLKPSTDKNKKLRAFIAVFVGNVRLIDNISLID